MANDTLMFFDGHFDKSDGDVFTEANLLRISRGKYIAVKIFWDGYLSNGGDPYVIGIIHSFSKIPDHFIYYLFGHAKGIFNIGYYDTDFPAVHIIVNKGEML